jgi:excisionase family DNA binding protein
VAVALNVSKAFAYRLMAEGRLRSVRLGRAVRVRQEDLDQFIELSVRPHPDHWPHGTGIAKNREGPSEPGYQT